MVLENHLVSAQNHKTNDKDQSVNWTTSCRDQVKRNASLPKKEFLMESSHSLRLWTSLWQSFACKHPKSVLKCDQGSIHFQIMTHGLKQIWLCTPWPQVMQSVLIKFFYWPNILKAQTLGGLLDRKRYILDRCGRGFCVQRMWLILCCNILQPRDAREDWSSYDCQNPPGFHNG